MATIPVEIEPVLDPSNIRKAVAGALADALEQIVNELRENLDQPEPQQEEAPKQQRRRRRTKAEIEAEKEAIANATEFAKVDPDGAEPPEAPTEAPAEAKQEAPAEAKQEAPADPFVDDNATDWTPSWA